ncbi:hypothetical protein [Micromonospora coerulea]|nr:hypothetical protein [Micromonospora veneta]
MDPQATIDAIFDALREGRWEDFRELWMALDEWNRKGGFTPTV